MLLESRPGVAHAVASNALVAVPPAIGRLCLAWAGLLRHAPAPNRIRLAGATA